MLFHFCRITHNACHLRLPRIWNPSFISNAGLQPPVYGACTAILIWVIPNQHFKSTLLGGGHKKEYAVYARENDDNYGRPVKATKLR